MKEITKFRINRRLWLTGRDKNLASSLMLDAKGRKCCLGFYASARGCTRHDLLDMSSPAEIIRTKQNMEDRFLLPEFINKSGKKAGENNRRAWGLMGTNDSESISDEKREAGVIERFARMGVEVEFYGQYPTLEDGWGPAPLGRRG